MHSRGTKLSTIVERVGGTHETLIDVPFDFNNQTLTDWPAGSLNTGTNSKGGAGCVD